MKTQINLLNQVTPTEFNKLTNQVNEVLDLNFKAEKQFSAADLWNIQRQRKAIRSRRYA